MKQRKSLAQLQVSAEEQLLNLHRWAAQTNQVLPLPPAVLAGAAAKLRWQVVNLTPAQRAAFLAPIRERIAAHIQQALAKAMAPPVGAPQAGRQPAFPAPGLRLVKHGPADK